MTANREPVLRVAAVNLCANAEARNPATELALFPGQVAGLSLDTPGRETLLQLVCGQRAPAGGEVHLAGLPAICWPAAELVRLLRVLRPLARRDVGGGASVDPALLRRALREADLGEPPDECNRHRFAHLLLGLWTMPDHVRCLVVDSLLAGFTPRVRDYAEEVLAAFATSRGVGILVLEPANEAAASRAR